MNGNTKIGSLAMQLRHHDIMQESMLQFFQLCPGVQITVVWINSYVMSYGFNTRSVLTMAAAKEVSTDAAIISYNTPGKYFSIERKAKDTTEGFS